jgi:hypothetical protein
VLKVLVGVVFSGDAVDVFKTFYGVKVDILYPLNADNPLEQQVKPKADGSPNSCTIEEIGLVPMLEVYLFTLSVYNGMVKNAYGANEVVVALYEDGLYRLEVSHQLLILEVGIAEAVLVQFEDVAIEYHHVDPIAFDYLLQHGNKVGVRPLERPEAVAIA